MTSDTFALVHQILARGVDRLSEEARDYVLGGAESETTVHANRASFDRQRFVPRVLRDVRNVDTTVEVLGQCTAMPLMLAPIGGLDRCCPNGCTVAARAAHEARIPMFFGSLDPTPLRDMRGATEGQAIYQLYVRGDKCWLDDRLAEISSHRFDGVCFTVDSAVYSRRERDLAKGRQKPYRAEFTQDAMRHSQALNWDDIARIAQDHKIPVILKGIASPQDALLAVQTGASAIYVSNHGGRQLDFSASSLDLLPGVVDAVEGQAEVYLDGGIQRGTDIIKACALGARAVGIGRLYCLAIAAGGQPALDRLLALLLDELQTSLALLGARNVAELCPEHLIQSPDAIREGNYMGQFC